MIENALWGLEMAGFPILCVGSVRDTKKGKGLSENLKIFFPDFPDQ
jgi:hypothetical protein